MNKSERGAKEFLENVGLDVRLNDKGQSPTGFKMPDFYLRGDNNFRAYCEFKNMKSIMEGGTVNPRKIRNKLFSKLKESGKQLRLNYKNLIQFVPNIAFLNCTDSSISRFDIRDILNDESTIPINDSKSYSVKMRKRIDKYLIFNIDMILLTNNNFRQHYSFFKTGRFEDKLRKVFT